MFVFSDAKRLLIFRSSEKSLSGRQQATGQNFCCARLWWKKGWSLSV